jgi:hypothetical protein
MAYVYALKGNGLTYFGSSTQNECERKSKHKSEYRHYLKSGKGNKCMVYLIFESYGDDWENADWTFEIIERFDTETKALEYENLCIINESCVNKNRAIGLTADELTTYKTEWARQNRLNKGVPTRVLYENPDDAPSRSAEYKREMTRKYRAEMSAEEKESILKKRRETSKTDTALQKNRDYLNDPEVKARRKQQQQEKRATMTEEQKKAQADRRKELYNAKKNRD